MTKRQLAMLAAARAAAACIGMDLPLPRGASGAQQPERWASVICALCEAGCLVFVGLSAGRVVAVRSCRDEQNRCRPCLSGLESMYRSWIAEQQIRHSNR